MDGIFPGALDLDAFWTNIINCVNQSAPVPPTRWIAPVEDRLSNGLIPDRPYSQHACLIHGFHFAPEAFRLPADLTRNLDPMHQLTLTAGRRAVAGCVTDPIDHQRVDTILAAIALPTDGASRFSRQLMSDALEARLFPDHRPTACTPNRHQALASRVDGFPATLLAAELAFGGTSFTLDAACASSIYAVKLACDRLIDGQADMVVTGGVSRPECLYTQTGFSQLQALSPSGRCAPFDRLADGLVVGEGVGILVLKRLDDALSHGDEIFGVIHGIGLSNDMRGNLLAPERAGQVRAMEQAYRLAGWRPSDVQLIECHGTGTRAGDTTEIESLTELWQHASDMSGTCAIGSVKSMIGHLLTAAGAAGMIKTLLAIRHRTLPPSINFEEPPPGSPLNNSPFKVQTTPGPWTTNGSVHGRRAAVSAFGFGGINAHILFEEWLGAPADEPSPTTAAVSIQDSAQPQPSEPVAIVGMEVIAGALENLNAFTRAVANGSSAISNRPPSRWKGLDSAFEAALAATDPNGAFMEKLDIAMGEFQIPPNEIADILPQQLLALKVGAGAMTDAGLALRQPRERMGVVMGIGFDFEATNFHLRWQLANAVKRWNREHGLGLGDAEMADWLEALRDGCGPPLTAPRVLGALGGIVASRMAREFRFGGPSFVVSNDAASGIHALGVAVDLLCQGTVDAMLVGAVDLAAEGRSVVRLNKVYPLSAQHGIRPFDAAADGTLPGDGAVALVVKTLKQARADGDRVYALIQGIGHAGGNNPVDQTVNREIYCRSLAGCLATSHIPVDAVSFVDAHAVGVPDQDRAELDALVHFFNVDDRQDKHPTVALGATKPLCGHTGAADGLMGLAKTAWCLYRRMLPALSGFTQLPSASDGAAPFHLPHLPQHWYRDRKRGPRTACCASITTDLSCSHVLLQEYEQASDRPVVLPPLDNSSQDALFVVTGDAPQPLLTGLDELDAHLRAAPDREPLAISAGVWMRQRPVASTEPLAVAIVLKTRQDAAAALSEARQAIESGAGSPRSNTVFYQSRPMGSDARVAMVYPGSGNHYLGMGRQLALRFPEIVTRMDLDTDQLQTQVRPWITTPWNASWPDGWEGHALLGLKSDPLNMLFAQVVFGDLMTRILKQFAVPTDAIIGYSLGESAGLFAHGIWPDRGEMLRRMQVGDLFGNQLAGPCRSLQKAWNIPIDQPVDWRVAVVNRPAKTVKGVIKDISHVRLLIVNTPDECVIGGLEADVAQTIHVLGCQAVYLDGVVTVHCDAATPVAKPYRDLHVFPTTAIDGLTVYSCSRAEAYPVTADSIADSIEKQAIEGFDFPRTIERAYNDGMRIFIEAGPRASCTRMIGSILGNRPHLAVAANYGMDDEIIGLYRCLAQLVTARVPLDLSILYPETRTHGVEKAHSPVTMVSVPIGGHPLTPVPPPVQPVSDLGQAIPSNAENPSGQIPVAPDAEISNASARPDGSAATIWSSLLETERQNMDATARSHEQFLDLSQELTDSYASLFDLQNRLLAMGARLDSARIR